MQALIYSPARKKNMKRVFTKSWAAMFLLCALANSATAASTPSAASASATVGLSEASQAWLKKSADEAQKSCYEYMHDDATEYSACLQALLTAVKGKSLTAQQQRLGITYFAWVGANNSARLSLPGAEQAAQTFLPKFRALQKQLKISDQDLCPSIAGDCKARVAQYLQMEKELQDLKKSALKNKASKTSKASNQ